VLAREVAPHFAPSEWLRQMAREGRAFYSKAPQPARHVDVPLTTSRPKSTTPPPAVPASA
jgi:hypothetical protein